MEKEILITGIAHKYGDNINTDEIIPARFLNTSDPGELAKHVLGDLDKNFVKKMRPQDIIVAGKNFGCGSSREHAPVAIKAAKVGAVIAESFARIFYRNAINIGLAILESPQASARIRSGDKIRINLTTGEIFNLTRKEKYQSVPWPEFMQNIIRAGGLMKYLQKRQK